MSTFKKLLFLALVTFAAFAQEGGHLDSSLDLSGVILLNEDGTPRCKVGGPYGRHLPPERFADFFANADGFPEELRKCGEEDVLYAHMVLSPEEIRRAEIVSANKAVTLFGGAAIATFHALGSCAVVKYDHSAVFDVKKAYLLGLVTIAGGNALAANLFFSSKQLWVKAKTAVYTKSFIFAGAISAFAYFACRIESEPKASLIQ